MKAWLLSSVMALSGISTLCSISTFASDFGFSDPSLRDEVRQLQRDVERLEARIIELQVLIRQQQGVTGSLEPPVIWGCYLDDIRAGGFFANALTEAEAKGRVLYKCKQADGVCWSNKVTCSQSR